MYGRQDGRILLNGRTSKDGKNRKGGGTSSPFESTIVVEALRVTCNLQTGGQDGAHTLLKHTQEQTLSNLRRVEVADGNGKQVTEVTFFPISAPLGWLDFQAHPANSPLAPRRS